MDMRPRNIAATVRYRPWRGSQAAIMFLASNICWVSSATDKARYCWLPRLVNGAKPGMKKWSRGNGTMLTASLRRSAFSCPGNLRHVVYATHGYRHQMVQVAVGRSRQFQGTEADVVQSFVVDAERLVGVLDQLVNGQRCVVRFDHCVRHFRRGDNTEGGHDSIRVFLADLGDEQCPESGAGATTPVNGLVGSPMITRR